VAETIYIILSASLAVPLATLNGGMRQACLAMRLPVYGLTERA